MGKYFKLASFAPGIPDKFRIEKIPTIQERTIWNFSIQEHLADKAGKHFDLRLGDPNTGNAHSWVIKEWPKPGEKVLAIQQPTHTTDYMNFSGQIESGYGKGKVNLVNKDKIEIIEAKPEKITFFKYSPHLTEKYSLIKINDKEWLLVNHTINKKVLKYFKEAPKFKTIPLKNEIKGFSVPKIDGAYSITILQPNKRPIIFSPRISKKYNIPIEYTPKIEESLDYIVPKSLGTTILRTEVFGVKNNEEIENRKLVSLLNSDVWKSRKLQKDQNTKLQVAITDVVKYKGKKVENLPIEEKYKIIEEISNQVPFLKNPLKLESEINFKEGRIIWKNGIPYKLKNIQDYDVYIQDVFPAKTKNKEQMAGGFLYSLEADGPIVGKVGTGFTKQERKDLLKNKDQYIGRVAKITALEQFPSGAYRQPSFIGLHLDK